MNVTVTRQTLHDCIGHAHAYLHSITWQKGESERPQHVGRND